MAIQIRQLAVFVTGFLVTWALLRIVSVACLNHFTVYIGRVLDVIVSILGGAIAIVGSAVVLVVWFVFTKRLARLADITSAQLFSTGAVTALVCWIALTAGIIATGTLDRWGGPQVHMAWRILIVIIFILAPLVMVELQLLLRDAAAR